MRQKVPSRASGGANNKANQCSSYGSSVGLFILRIALLFIEHSAMALGSAAIRLAQRSCRRGSFPLAKAAIYVAAIADWLAGKLG